ncbi:MAG TPA: 50S ribosomal protein L7/L12 [Syntrophorhabdaceae bacterium]|nr:50S ribosomal protein L7/L12 [Syntrophorhabdaceae bacterium]HPU30571.1 50S ribosomal protein L7/L12 [Syntrophorhabdaceae bacterium]
MNITKEDVIKFIENMTVLELSEFIKTLEERFGVQAAMPIMAAAGPAAQAPTQEAAPQEEKTEFNVILTGYEADKKIQVIKVVRAITNLGLKEAKDLVEGVPKPVKEGVSKEEAANIKKQLEEVSGQVKIE